MIEKVDVIITTKNRLNELLYTLNHMISIGLSENQFYIIDDCSTDGTFHKIKELFPAINIQENVSGKTFVQNRSDMMQRTSRDFVLSVDDDSHIISREDLKEALSILDSDNTYGIFHFRVFNQISPPPSKDLMSKKIRFLRGYVGCGHIIKREVINAVGRYREELIFYFEELDYSLRAFNLGFKVVSKDDLIVHHRIDLELRKKQKSTINSQGVFGREWRNSLLYSNNLIITYLHYPIGLDFIFILYRMFLAFYKILILERQPVTFFKVIKRFFSLLPYAIRNSSKLSYKEFFTWFSFPDMTDGNSKL